MKILPKQSAIPWHSLPLEEVYAALDTSRQGLPAAGISRRLEEYGHNKIEGAKPKSVFSLFFKQFQSPLIYILLISIVIVVFLREYVDAAIIFAVLLLNAAIGTVQEGKAQNILRALQHFVQGTAIVVRGGKEVNVVDEHIVPGDVFLLREGDKVPADARVIHAQSLSVDESALTGESEIVEKHADVIPGESIPLTDKSNMLFRGTYVTGGTAYAVVVATGANTVIGAIAAQLSFIDTDVPLKKSIEVLSRNLILIVAGVIGIILVFGWGQYSFPELFKTVVAVAVAAIPESLPVVVTLILAGGVHRMSKYNALVKRLQAVEALGQADILAVDKTGTITRNEMMVEEVFVGGETFFIKGEGYAPEGEVRKEVEGREIAVSPGAHSALMDLARGVILTANATISYDEESQAWKRHAGDPTEAAMVVFAKKMGFSKADLEQEYAKRAEQPFSSATRFHSVVHFFSGKSFMSISGSPEEIMERSVLSDIQKKELEEVQQAMMKKGLRVIAVGSKVVEGDRLIEPEKVEFVGFVGIKDSMRPEVPAAVAEIRKAGIKVIMITGDHEQTARSIAVAAGIFEEGDKILHGKQIVSMSDSELEKAVGGVAVFPRVSPDQKLRIIAALRKRGHVVAMTGDGVNDALSLMEADLGVAMGKIGTEVSKEAADIVLLDDKISSITRAIEEGRHIYLSVKRTVLYLLSTNIGEIGLIAVAVVAGYPLPLAASQILWLNMVTDSFLVAALAAEKKDSRILSTKARRYRASIVDGMSLVRIGLIGGVMIGVTFIVFSWYLPEGVAKASTAAFIVLTAFQWFNIFNIRSESASAFSGASFFKNWYLNAALVAVVLLQVAAVEWAPLQGILNTTSLSLNEWITLIGLGVSVLLVEEIRKLVTGTGGLWYNKPIRNNR